MDVIITHLFSISIDIVVSLHEQYFKEFFHSNFTLSDEQILLKTATQFTKYVYKSVIMTAYGTLNFQPQKAGNHRDSNFISSKLPSLNTNLVFQSEKIQFICKIFGPTRNFCTNYSTCFCIQPWITVNKVLFLISYCKDS